MKAKREDNEIRPGTDDRGQATNQGDAAHVIGEHSLTVTASQEKNGGFALIPTLGGDHNGSIDDVHTAAVNTSLEDRLYHADLQYRHNYGSSISVAEDGKDGSDRLSELAPAQAIERSPIWYLLGPASPAVAEEQTSQCHALTGKTAITAWKENENMLAVTSKTYTDTHAEEDDPDARDRKVLRRLTMVSAFFLLTTDILGPFSAGYVVSQLGFVPAVILYIVMGLAAFCAGILLNTLYLRLDSQRLPISNYASLAHCLWGRWGRKIVDFLLFVQLLISCAGLLLTNGQSLGQIIDGANGGVHHVCFSVIVLIFLAIALCLSPIRSLRSISWFARPVIFLTVVSMICCVAFAYVSPPNYYEARVTFGIQPGPVRTAAFENLPLTNQLTGVLNMVYAYGGALLFIDILNEMRRPWDFYKSLFFAQLFIMCVYMAFGILMYARQGQFSQSLAYYGASKYAYQTVGNAIGFSTGIIVALLYGNIAQKRIYYIVVRTWFKGPSLMTRQGFKWWMVGNAVFWCLAYVVSVSVPQVQTFAALVAAICTLQFSFTFPFMLKLTFEIQVDAMRGDRPYVANGKLGIRTHRVDTWRQWSRWKRGLTSGNVAGKGFLLLLSVGSVFLALLGIGASIYSIIDTFRKAEPTSFGCKTP